MTVLQYVLQVCEQINLDILNDLEDITIGDGTHVRIGVLGHLDASDSFDVTLKGGEWRLQVREYGWVFALRTASNG